MPFARRLSLIAVCGLLSSSAFAADKPAPAEKTSYFKQIRPIFQAHCQGCHQPAKSRGDYVMTAMKSLFEGGASGEKAVVPGKPGESKLLKDITPVNGKARMPEGKKPLHESEIELVKKWIAEGAVDDTPLSAGTKIDPEHPPVYTRPPVVASIDYSPDGKLLAVSGFHEVLLVDPESNALKARLVGLSERVQSVMFSPDGKQLAVAGGNPARMGEIQVWDVEKKKLLLSKSFTGDTLYGVSWSPDGKRIAFGASDNVLRAIDSKTGEQVLQQGAHNDWVLGTIWSKDGSHLASVGRDMAAKLTEFATQRFIDNITSITPGALKGGLQALARHPERDEIVVGGADGIPKVYRMHRQTIRVIGDDGNLIRQMPGMNGRIFSVAVSKDGKRIAAGSGLDGAGEIAVFGYEFDTKLPEDVKAINQKVDRSPDEKKKLDAYHAAGVVQKSKLAIPSGIVYAVAYHPNNKLIAASGGDGQVRIIDGDTGKVVKTLSPAPVVSGSPDKPATIASKTIAADFAQDVAPIMSRLGCNAGTCHGSAQGKNGFKLSLRGYDPLFDVRALTDELASRRVNVSSPDDSLMLLKITGAAPHAGGALIKSTDPYYQTIRTWIANGAKLNTASPRVVAIEVEPKSATLSKEGESINFKVTATFADGKKRNVTQEAFIESGNTEVASASTKGGLLTALRRGEAPVLARYEGAYAAVTLTVMGDRTGFTWSDPPTNGKIDELVAAKWKQLKIQPSGLCTDEEFLRRVHFDLTGLPPTAEQVREFLADHRPTWLKREAVVDRLIGSKEFIEHWTNKWADLLQVNRKFLGVEGSVALRKWIRTEVEKNTPYDEFVRKIVTASGSNYDNPAAAYFKILRDPESTLENTTHLFLAVRFNCNKCHDHPFERWTQDDYYQTAAFFANVGLNPDPRSAGKNIGGTAVEGAKPLYEIVVDRPTGEVKHLRTSQPAPPRFPFVTGKIPQKPTVSAKPEAGKRKLFADWLTAPENPYFAKSHVNRLWGYFFGAGIIEPIDDIRAGNPASNPELLDYLTREFIDDGFDSWRIMAAICKSRTYQLSIKTNKWNEDDKRNYSHATARRLPAEALLDAVYRATGTTSNLPGLPAGARAAELPDAGAELPSGFLGAFGRPVRESACECERSASLQLGPVMALVNGQTVADAVADPNNAITKLVATEKDDRKMIAEIFLRVLNRNATDAEIDATLANWKQIEHDHAALEKEYKTAEAAEAPKRKALEDKRLADLPKAKADLEALKKQLAPVVAAARKKQEEEVKKLQAELKTYEESLLKKHADFDKKNDPNVQWTVLKPTSYRALNKGTLKLHPDGVVETVKARNIDTFSVVAETDLKGITALRLEVLADPKAPNGGPGKAPDGNFVLTEFQVLETPDGTKNGAQFEIAEAKADFEQNEFPITSTFDGLTDAPKGWAVYPSFGVTHWATFKFKKPIGDGKKMKLKIALHQRFNSPNFFLGKFRLSATTVANPGLSQSEELAAIYKTPSDKRTAAQKDALSKYFGAIDGGHLERRFKILAANAPLPPDPKVTALEQSIARLSMPTPESPQFVQLRNDFLASEAQNKNHRLTGAQDLAWALLNSPAFLFNR